MAWECRATSSVEAEALPKGTAVSRATRAELALAIGEGSGSEGPCRWPRGALSNGPTEAPVSATPAPANSHVEHMSLSRQLHDTQCADEVLVIEKALMTDTRHCFQRVTTCSLLLAQPEGTHSAAPWAAWMLCEAGVPHGSAASSSALSAARALSAWSV